jgi:hypothetical protein
MGQARRVWEIPLSGFASDPRLIQWSATKILMSLNRKISASQGVQTIDITDINVIFSPVKK